VTADLRRQMGSVVNVNSLLYHWRQGKHEKWIFIRTEPFMEKLVLTLLVLTTVALLGDILCHTLNRDIRWRLKIAKAIASYRIRQRTEEPKQAFLNQLPQSTDHEAALRVLESFAKVIKVPVGTLRPEDKLPEMLRVYFDEAGNPVPGKTSVFIDAFWQDFLILSQDRLGKGVWCQIAHRFAPTARSEDDILDAMLQHDFKDIVLAVVDGQSPQKTLRERSDNSSG
jgi:hypothetical protein